VVCDEVFPDYSVISYEQHQIAAIV
jgi:hypothetical protein